MLPKLNDIVQFPNRLQNQGDYWQYLTSEFGIYLHNYLSVFEQHRQNTGLIPSEKDWKQLPFGAFAQTSDWKWRRQSLAIIQHLTKNKAFKSTLEIGSWNGWLTKHLARKTETIVAADYFVCPFDGIGNIQSLAENITAIQCNLEHIGTDFKPQTFDLIVLNHHLAYMNNPVDYAKQIISLLKPNGSIISIGNTFFKNPDKKIKANMTFAEQFYIQYGMDLYIQPLKGYMTFDDWTDLKNSGFEVKPYPTKLLQNICSKWNVSAPFYAYLIYQHTT